MAFSLAPKTKHALKIAGAALGTPVAAFGAFTAASHGVWHRSNMATASEMYNWLMGTRKRMNEPVTWDNYILEQAEANEHRYSIPKTLDFHYKLMGFRVPVDETSIDGSQVYLLNRHDINDRAVIYLHGGAFLRHPNYAQWHFIDGVARRTRAEVVVPIYPLAPVHHFEEAFDLIKDVYDQTVEKYGADSVTILGDEAGGGLAAGFCEWLAQQGRKQPAHLILISPWVHLSLVNPAVELIQPKDPILSAYGLRKVGKLWAKGTEPDDYRLNPVDGDVHGLRNVLVFAGTREILYPDAKLFLDRVRATGAYAEFVEGRGLNNNFPMDPLPEANDALNKIVDTVAQD